MAELLTPKKTERGWIMPMSAEAEIDDFDREIELTRQNEELMRLLDSRGREKANIPLDEAKARLGIDKEVRVDG